MGNWLENIFFFIIGTLLTAFVGYIVFYLVDSSFLDATPKESTVISKDHTPGHFQSVVSTVNKTTTVSQVWVPESWSATVSFKGYETHSCSITEYVYNRIEQGDKGIGYYVSGRISGWTYCNSFELE